MSTKRVRLITLCGLGLIALAVGIGLLLMFAKRYTRQVELPVTTSAAAASGEEPSGGLTPVTVTKDNVRQVVATLKRPVSYTRQIRIEQYSAGNSAVFNISAAVLNNVSSLKVIGAGAQKNIIVTKSKRYVWYDGDSAYYTGAVGGQEDAEKASDEDQMIMTYQDVVNLEQSDVTDAGYGKYNDENCIYVTYTTPLLNYTATCYISPVSGLLVGAEQYDGATRIYRMTTSGLNLTAPGADRFSLPDGSNVINALSQG